MLTDRQKSAVRAPKVNNLELLRAVKSAVMATGVAWSEAHTLNLSRWDKDELEECLFVFKLDEQEGLVYWINCYDHLNSIPTW